MCCIEFRTISKIIKIWLENFVFYVFLSNRSSAALPSRFVCDAWCFIYFIDFYVREILKQNARLFGEIFSIDKTNETSRKLSARNEWGVLKRLFALSIHTNRLDRVLVEVGTKKLCLSLLLKIFFCQIDFILNPFKF